MGVAPHPHRMNLAPMLWGVRLSQVDLDVIPQMVGVDPDEYKAKLTPLLT